MWLFRFSVLCLLHAAVSGAILGTHKKGNTDPAKEMEMKLVKQKRAFAAVAKGLIPQNCSKTGKCAILAGCAFSIVKMRWNFACHESTISAANIPEMAGFRNPDLLLGQRFLKQIDFDHTSGFRCGGRLVSEVGQLTTLKRIVLRGCKHGSLPTQLGNLQRLDELRFRKCSFTGAIPSEIGKLQQFSTIWWKFVPKLAGTIPTEVGTCKKLSRLSITVSGIGGPLPSELGKLSKLYETELEHARFSGSIPSNIGALSILTEIHIDDNRLEGVLPTELTRIQALDSLWLKMNHLEGSFAQRIGLLPGQTHDVDLASNRFKGSLTSDIGKLSKLRELRLYQNKLQGSIPSEIGSLRQLQILQLGENRFKGKVPTDLGKFGLVMYLALNSNEFTGPIPPELFTPLVSAMLLHENRLQGEIPEALVNSSWLSMLTLHDNSLQGRIPQFNFSCPAWYPEKPLFTTHGNRLSCKIPSVRFLTHQCYMAEDSWMKPQSVVLPGNMFSRPVPDWLPDQSRAAILMTNDHAMNETVGAICVFSVIIGGLHVLLTHANRGKETIKSTSDTNLELIFWIERQYYIFLRSLLVGGVLSVGALMPLYYHGSYYYKCGDRLVQWTAAYLYSPVNEFIVGLLWALFLFITKENILACFPGERNEYTDKMTWRRLGSRIFYWCGFGMILLAYSIPGMVYAISRSAPSHNLIAKHMGRAYYYTSKAAPVVLYFVDLQFSWTAKRFSRTTSISYLRLKGVGRLVKWCVVPVLVLCLVHENCVGGWRWLSTSCRKPEKHFLFQFYGIDVVKPSDICDIQSWRHFVRRGRCSRSIVETLTPLFVQKTLVYSILSPLNFLLSWLLWKRKYWPFHFHPITRQNVELLTWSQIAMLWGAIMPLLMPVIFLALMSNLLAFRFCAWHLKWAGVEKRTNVKPMREFFAHLPIFIGALMLIFCWESRVLSGITFVPVFAILVSGQKWYRRQHTHTNGQRKSIDATEFTIEMADIVDILSHPTEVESVLSHPPGFQG